MKKNYTIVTLKGGNMEYNYESNYVNKDTGFMFRYICCETERLVEHWHDYFEIFLILEGSVTHNINGITQHLVAGSLVFIRPGDIHKYICEEDKVRFLNLAISKRTMYKLIDYLGSAFDSEKIFGSPVPPTVTVSEKFKSKMLQNFQRVNTLEAKDVQRFKLFMRKYLIEIITSCFTNSDVHIENEDNIPEWLVDVCKQMYVKDNFVAGNKRMIELSGKSREYLGRSLKKYMNTSLSEFVHNIRLDYASNVLINSNLSIVDVCFDCGFDNVSYFYRKFSRRYGVSPSVFRKNHSITN